jgi:preprotein translocase SecE subunit
VWKIYKEGQGKWARGVLAFVVAIGAIFTVVSLHESIPSWGSFTLPVLRWNFDYRWLVEGPILIAAVVFGVWIFNHPTSADFLIETENELKNKVTWPSKKEEINASIVVVIAVLVLGAFIFSIDLLLAFIQKQVFGSGGA